MLPLRGAGVLDEQQRTKALSPPRGSQGNTTNMPYLQQPTPRLQPGAGQTPVPRTSSGVRPAVPMRPEVPGLHARPYTPMPVTAAAQPPAQPAAPQAQNPLAGLGERIAQWLQQPSGFNAPEVMRTRDLLKRKLKSDIDVDAAKRGVGFGTAPTAIYGNEMGKIDTELLTRMAQTQGSDLAAAVSAGQRFGEAGQQGTLARLGMAIQAAGLGEQGQPNINQLLMSLAGMGMAPGASVDPNVMALLGQLFG